jgi:hypothetical protein
MTLNLGLPAIGMGVILLAALQFLASLWISERLKISLQKEHSTFLESLRWDIKVREQAVRVAEYLALAISLKEDSTESDYRKANQLSWELAMWLPSDIYNHMVSAVANPNQQINALTAVLSVRAILLKQKAGKLTPEDIASHSPGIGRKLANRVNSEAQLKS